MKTILTILLACSFIAAQSTPVSVYNATTNRTNYLEPAITGPLDLSLPGRGIGYSFPEPLLSTALFTRITDAGFDPCNVGHNFSAPDTAETRAWNITATRLHLLDLNSGVLWPLNWNGTAISKVGSAALPCGGISSSGLLTGGAALPSWSGKDADIWWGTLGFKLRRLNFSAVTGSSTTIPFTEPLDYNTIYHAITGGNLVENVDYMCSLGVSGVDAANDFIATAMSGAQDTWKYAVWWDSATGRYKVLDTFSNPMRTWDSNSPGWVTNAFAGGYQLHNVKLAQDGRWVLITPTGSRQIFWDTQTNAVSQSTLALDGGHRSGGYGYVFNQYANGSDASQWMKRAMSDLTNPLFLVNPTLSSPSSVPQYVALNPDFDEHSSTHNQRSGSSYPLFSSTSRIVDVDLSHPWRPYDNEIVAIGTDTTRIVYRIAHHMSKNTNGGPRAPGYYDNAFGQESADGRWFVVGTNWGMTLTYASGTNPNTGSPCAPCYRIDAFVVKLPTGSGTVTLTGKATISGRLQ